MRKIILLMSILAMHWAAAQQQTSPDGNVVLSFSLKADGTPTYKMTYGAKKKKSSTITMSCSYS